MNNIFSQMSNKFADFLNIENAHFLKEKHKMLCLLRFLCYKVTHILCFSVEKYEFSKPEKSANLFKI